jgi:hypothetical protein
LLEDGTLATKAIRSTGGKIGEWTIQDGNLISPRISFPSTTGLDNQYGWIELTYEGINIWQSITPTGIVGPIPTPTTRTKIRKITWWDLTKPI